MADDRQMLLDLVKQVLESTIPFPSAWEESSPVGPDLEVLWHELREILHRHGVEVVASWEES